MPFDEAIYIRLNVNSEKPNSLTYVNKDKFKILINYFDKEFLTPETIIKDFLKNQKEQQITKQDFHDSIDDFCSKELMQMILPFSIQKSCIILGETFSQSPSKKRKKETIAYITNKKYINNNKVKNSIQTKEVYEAFSVCGHWRFYYLDPKNPSLGLKNINGKDRNGKEIKGKTWIQPYTKGRGEEIERRIRFFTGIK